MRQPILILFSCALCLGGCSNSHAPEDSASQQTPYTAVTLTQGTYGTIKQTITLPATTAYLDKSVVTAPIAAFISEANVQRGTRVKAGQLLYRLESKEQHAISETGNKTTVPLNATQDGFILEVGQQAGDYVPEGTTLCTIAESGSLVFEINVPYEQRKQVQAGKRFTIELPDGTQLPATVEQTLGTMDTASQSERVVARAKTPFLPEGMVVKALFPVESPGKGKTMILPKQAVQSDETLREHWVMKLADDSTAVKIPVTVTGSNAMEMEILPGSLSVQDSIILDGSYGLEEGTKVVVTK